MYKGLTGLNLISSQENGWIDIERVVVLSFSLVEIRGLWRLVSALLSCCVKLLLSMSALGIRQQCLSWLHCNRMIAITTVLFTVCSLNVVAKQLPASSF